ncbi:MAG TPA: hypothetical protein VFD32_04305 [Dehalococcoidia bacterium]|nr:hypothetical protein [Dehalococcoidia bacterium]
MWGRLSLLLLLAAISLACPPLRPAAVRAAPAVRIAMIRGGDLYLLDAATGAETRLTNDGGNMDPRWNPDGTILTFVKAPATGPQLWRGTASRGVEQTDFPAFWGVVSPDGEAWAYSDRGPRGVDPVWVAAPAWINEHGLRSPIAPNEDGVRWEPLAWSPDGRTVALTHFNGLPPPPYPTDFHYNADATLWLTVGDPLAGKRLQLQMPPSFNDSPGVPDYAWFSPAGRFLTVGVGPAMPCNSCRADGLPIYAVPVDGGAPIALGDGLGRASVAWAPDDAFAVVSGPIGRWDYTNKHLTLTDTRTGAQRPLTDDPTAADTAPAVSPAGTLIAFVRGRDPGGPVNGVDAVNAALATRRIWLATPDGGLRPLDPGVDGWADDAPAWTPDGGAVVFVRARPSGDELELWMIPVAGGPPRRLATDLGPRGGLGHISTDLPFLAAMYVAVQPNPAVAPSRVAALGSGGAAGRGRGALPLVGAGLALLGAGCGLLKLARRTDRSSA